MSKHGAVEPKVEWDAVWLNVATRLSQDSLAPKFLTEDDLRVATLRALELQIDVMQYAHTECDAASLGGIPRGRIDLVINTSGGQPWSSSNTYLDHGKGHRLGHFTLMACYPIPTELPYWRPEPRSNLDYNCSLRMQDFSATCGGCQRDLRNTGEASPHREA